jgi:integrase/recombinase XerD
MPASAISKQTVLQFLQWFDDRGRSAGTARRHLTSLKRMLGDVPGMDPMVYKVKGPKLPRRVARPMDFTDAMELLEQFDPKGDDKQLRNRIILELLLACGLRISEVLNITPEFIFRERSTKLVRVVIPKTKNKREHTVEIPPRTVPLLDELERRNKLAGREGVYFMQKTTHTQKLTYEYFRKEFKRALVRAGLESKTKIHALRATFATVLLARGVPREKVSDLLNQINPASILPYDGFTGSDREGLVRTHHPLFQDPTSKAPEAAAPEEDVQPSNRSNGHPFKRPLTTSTGS